MNQLKKAATARPTPRAKRPLREPIDTESAKYQRDLEDTFQKAEEMRAAADTLLRLSLAHG
jgi:hypothetical protein